jgi:magnesium chelatase family protein
MVARISTVAFQGIDVIPVDVQVQMSAGMPNFTVVGLADKAVGESRERVRAALHAIGLSLPPKRITVNLSPADILKEGSHYDLPIALGLLVSMDILPAQEISEYTALGELALDGSISRVSGVLPAAIDAASRGQGLICPKICGAEAAWAQGITLLAPGDLLALINHFKGTQILSPPEPKYNEAQVHAFNMSDIKGQEASKRALEIAAAGGHNFLMKGPPGAGKSLMASALPGLLPPLSPQEALEVTMVHSVAGLLEDGKLIRQRPFRDPHHSASLPALIGGGSRAKPGEVSLAHLGVLFLDELPEFQRSTLEALRQPIETGSVSIARAQAHVSYPARFQVVAAMNPCRCGHMDDVDRACSRAPKCGLDYQAKISGPLIDRMDIQVNVPAVRIAELSHALPGEDSQTVAARVIAARKMQTARYEKAGTNSYADGKELMAFATPDAQGQKILEEAAEKLKLSARGYHRILRVARTIADLDNSKDVRSLHIAEAITYRQAA